MMKVILAFNESGDTIEFDDVLLPDVTEYYVNYITEHNVNKFNWLRAKSSLRWFNKESLKEVFDEVNTYLNEVHGVTVFNKFDLKNKYFDQDQLNEIHRAWVKLCQDKDLSIVHRLSVESPEMYSKYQMLNSGTHYAEKGWGAAFLNEINRPPNFVKPPVNIFDQERITSFDLAGLSLRYGGLGRQTYNKWELDDEAISETDTTNFEEFYGVVKVNLIKPQEVIPPAEYIEYCKRHNVPALGSHINLANITDYKSNMNQNRSILYRNTILSESSTSSLHIG